MKVDRALRAQWQTGPKSFRGDKQNIARGARDPPVAPMLGLARGQAEGRENTMQVIVAVIFDLDAPSFLAVVNYYPRTEMLLQSSL